ncbi:hypothetical protein [Algicella marina]|uniref:Uncharacterized protein n=1 Tax=Algicella marina TaxID=2683284 RepID=A0A6P1T5H0_9RHOB|nr:hypothetical protein [Algicella marina]QHQ36716.1 hypothetical protein GO499_16810 [Algicella marina]
MAIITKLERAEPARLDVRAVELMESILGQARCREVMEETCFDLVDCLAAIEASLHVKDHAKSRRLATEIASLSAQIGLDDFSLSARNLMDCIDTGNWTALAPVTARMMRLGEASLMSLLDLSDDPYA